RAPLDASAVSTHAATWAESSTNESESPSAGSHSAVPHDVTAPPPAALQGRASPTLSTADVHVAERASHSSCKAPSSRVTGPAFVLAMVSKNATRRPPVIEIIVSVWVVPAVSRTDALLGKIPNRARVRAWRLPPWAFATYPLPRSEGEP